MNWQPYLTLLFVLAAVASSRRPFSDDEDDDDQDSDIQPVEAKFYTYDEFAQNTLCAELGCKKNHICAIINDSKGRCISHQKIKHDKQLHHEYRRFTKNKQKALLYNCKPCPVVRPDFVCGSDGKTYASACRLEYEVCVTKRKIALSCKGPCPCKTDDDIAFEDDENEETNEARLGGGGSQWKAKYFRTLNKNDKETNAVFDKVYFKNDPEGWQEQPEDTVDSEYDESATRDYANSHADKECTDVEMRMMGDRMLDWFHVIMVDAKRAGSNVTFIKEYWPRLCRKSAGWMFGNLDEDRDDTLSLSELASIENVEYEHCVKPFIDRCDTDMDAKLNREEWCKCFEEALPPCLSSQQKVPTIMMQGVLKTAPGSFVPKCNEEGYYEKKQCHASTGYCWCVDKHGNEFLESRVRDDPNCDDFDENIPADRQVAPQSELIADEDADEEIEGSGFNE